MNAPPPPPTTSKLTKISSASVSVPITVSTIADDLPSPASTPTPPTIASASLKRTASGSAGNEKKHVEPLPELSKEVKSAYAIVADLANQESWENKARFPATIKGPLLDCARKALVNRSTGYILEESFFAHLQVVLPYNRFTLKKLIYKNILPGWIQELETQKEQSIEMFAKRIHSSMGRKPLGLGSGLLGLGSGSGSGSGGFGSGSGTGSGITATTATEAGSGMQEQGSDLTATSGELDQQGVPKKMFIWTQDLRLLLWEIMEKYMEIRAATAELSNVDELIQAPPSETELRNLASESLLRSFPEETMTAQGILRQYIQLKDKIRKQQEADQEALALAENEDASRSLSPQQQSSSVSIVPPGPKSPRPSAAPRTHSRTLKTPTLQHPKQQPQQQPLVQDKQQPDTDMASAATPLYHPSESRPSQRVLRKEGSMPSLYYSATSSSSGSLPQKHASSEYQPPLAPQQQQPQHHYSQESLDPGYGPSADSAREIKSSTVAAGLVRIPQPGSGMTLDSDESARAAAGGGGPGSGSGLGLRKTKSWNLQSRDQGLDVHRRLEYEAQDAHQSGSMEYGPQHSYPQLRTFFAPIEKREPPALNHSPQQHHRYPQHQPPQQQQQQQQQRQHPAHDYPPSHYQSSGPGYGYQGHPSHPEAGLKGAPGSQHGDPRNMPRYSREPEGGDVDWSASGAAAGGDEAESRRKRTRVYDRDSAGYYQQDPNLLERDPRPPAGYPGGQGPGQGSHGSMPSGRSPLPMSPSLRAKAPLQPLAPQPAPLQHPRDASGGPPHGGSTPSDMRMARREYDRPEYDYDPGRYRPHGGEPPQDSYGHSWRESAHHERGREMAEGRRVHQDLLGGPAPPPPPPPPSQPSSQPSGHSPYSHTTQPPMPPYTSRPYPPPHHGYPDEPPSESIRLYERRDYSWGYPDQERDHPRPYASTLPLSHSWTSSQHSGAGPRSREEYPSSHLPGSRPPPSHAQPPPPSAPATVVTSSVSGTTPHHVERVSFQYRPSARQQNSNPNPPPASTTPQQQQQKPHDDRQPADPAAIAPSLSTPTSGYDHPQRYDRDRDYGYDQGPR